MDSPDRPPSQDPPVLPIGTVLSGKYRVEEVLGRGGMGVVLAARHEVLGHRVALKVLSGAAGPVAVARFLREARATLELKSEQVVRVLDEGRTDDGVFRGAGARRVGHRVLRARPALLVFDLSGNVSECVDECTDDAPARCGALGGYYGDTDTAAVRLDQQRDRHDGHAGGHRAAAGARVPLLARRSEMPPT